MGSNLELYSTATHNSVLGFFAELCLLLGARRKTTYCTKSWTSFTSTRVCISRRERGAVVGSSGFLDPAVALQHLV